MTAFLVDVILGFNDFVLVYFLLLNTSYLTFFLASLGGVLRHLGRLFASDERQVLQSDLAWPISILVPAFDEEKTIVETVRSLLRVRYAEFEVVVVSDGSTDRTVANLVEAWELTRLDRPNRQLLATAPVRAVYGSLAHPNLVVVDKEGGGKPDALNCGINVARYPLFCSFDADSVIEDDALLRVVKPFLENPEETVAAGGIVRVVNGCRVAAGRVSRIRVSERYLPLVQVVEYLREFLVGRVSWSLFRSVMIVSGAFGLYRREAVVSAGGYRDDTDTEDLELILRLHRHMREQKRNYRIVFVPDPVCWTEVPEHLGDLLRQRKRWHRGLIQSLLAHGAMFLNPRYGPIGMFAFPFFVFFEMLGPVVEFLGYGFVITSFLLGFLDVHFLFLFVCVAILYGIFLSVAAVVLDELSFQRYPGWANFARMLAGAFLEHLGYRQTVVLAKVWAFFDVLVRRRRWGRARRAGFQEPPERRAAPGTGS